MKKLLIIIVLILVCSLAGCSRSSGVSGAEADKRLAASIQQTMKSRNMDVDIDLKRLSELKEPQGFYFYKVTIKFRDRETPQEQYLFFDGKYIAPDFINHGNNLSLSRELQFEREHTDIDLSNLSLIYGSAGAENVVVKITDFECPYCRVANAYLEEKLRGRSDVAVYIVHFPLTSIHKKAELFAKIFEAGNVMEKNFAHELFSNDLLLSMPEADIITYFAAKSGDDVKFRNLLASDDIDLRLRELIKLAQSYGVNATPVIYINGKRIEGFDMSLMDKAIESFK